MVGTNDYAMDTTSDAPPTLNYKPRRPHRKSRQGCTECKRQRRKCDEVAPRCTRCMKRNLCCQYPTKPTEIALPKSPVTERSLSPSNELSGQLGRLTYTDSKYLTPFHNSSSAPTSLTSIEPLSPLSCSSRVEELVHVNGQTNEILDGRELDLLAHYISHTAPTIAFDKDDLYVLQVGFPNLAFRSKPLMRSIMALAAVCKCHHVLEKHNLRPEDEEQIRDLLSFADQNHTASLQQTQAEIPNTNYCDFVLSNAPLMVLYSCGNHAVRIRFAQRLAEKSSFARSFAPIQSQWISLIRATHLAFIGLLNAQPEREGCQVEQTGSSPTENLVESFDQVFSDSNLLSPENGPTEDTRNLFLPIIASTSSNAVGRLRSRVQLTLTLYEIENSYLVQGEDHDSKGQEPHGENRELHACKAALDALTQIMHEVFQGADVSQKNSASVQQSAFWTGYPPLGRLSEVSPWLRDYLARVTSATQSRPLRRTVTMFLNRVPGEYLELVQTLLEFIPNQNDATDKETLIINNDQEMSQLNAAHRLALDIFAHWLVLVQLLDGVWWIGSIGAWELGRVVSFMRQQGWNESMIGAEQDWWPESMYNIGKEIGKHVGARGRPFT